MNLSKTLFAALLSTVLAQGTALAQDEAKPIKGFELGASLGYGIPMGDAQKSSALSDAVSGKIPLEIDAGYRINENIYAGLYFQYALAMLADKACPSGADCSGAVMRYGVEAQYHIMPREKWDPWAGLGLGMETVGYTVKAGGSEATATISGLEFLHLSGGADYRINDNVAVGPFLTVTVSQYSRSEVEAGGKTLGGDITNKTIHEWLILGVRGRFNL